MTIDVILALILLILLGFYGYTVLQRKGKEKNTMQSPSTEKEEQERPNFNFTVGSQLIHYGEYHMAKVEFYKFAIFAGLFFMVLGYLFYENAIVAILMACLGLFYPRLQRKKLLEKRKETLELQFKEAIASLSSSLAAGRSIENGFREVAGDLKLLYPDLNTHIIREFDIINRRVENGESIERAIDDFARRSDIEDILNFSDVFITCKRTGGDLVEVIRRTSDIISEKMEIKQEIAIMVAQKRFESKILSLIPLGMILLLKVTAADYMAPLYQWKNLGPLVMTGCLGLLGFSYWMGQKIMNIEV